MWPEGESIKKEVRHGAFLSCHRNPELRAKVDKMGFFADYKSPAEQSRQLREDYDAALVIAKKIGLRK